MSLYSSSIIDSFSSYKENVVDSHNLSYQYFPHIPSCGCAPLSQDSILSSKTISNKKQSFLNIPSGLRRMSFASSMGICLS